MPRSGSARSSAPGLPASGSGCSPPGLGLWAAPPLLRLHDRVSEALLRPTGKAVLALRVQELSETRTEAVDAQAAELRRIERDLHDGVQARLIAVGLNLGAIEQLTESDPAAARMMAAQARESSERALAELRGLVRGIHPPVLAERGLVDAVRAVAVDSPLDAEVTADLAGEVPPRCSPPSTSPWASCSPTPPATPVPNGCGSTSTRRRREPPGGAARLRDRRRTRGRRTHRRGRAARRRTPDSPPSTASSP